MGKVCDGGGAGFLVTKAPEKTKEMLRARENERVR